jgi:hypothetical protein
VEQVFKEDRYMAPHYAYYVREMKIKAYAQVRGLKIRIYVSVFRIHDSLVCIRIRIRGSMPLTNGSGSGCASGSFYFHH